eukprot:EG_transcript_21030
MAEFTVSKRDPATRTYAVFAFLAFSFVLYMSFPAPKVAGDGPDSLYSLWIRPPDELAAVLAKEIHLLADEFQGSRHPPHVTLCGPIYTTDKQWVIKEAETLCKSIEGPIALDFNFVDLNRFNASRRFPAYMAVRYKNDRSFTAAAREATRLYAPHVHSVQRPHLSLLYDFEGRSSDDPANNASTLRRLRQSGQPLSFTASEVQVWATPCREHWRSAADMISIISRWSFVHSCQISKLN